MPLAKLIRSTPFRLAALYAGIFLLSLFAGNVSAYRMVAAYLYERLDSHVMERFREIEAAYTTQGVEGAATMIENHAPAILRKETLYLLRDPAGEMVAGNFDLPEVPVGFQTFESSGPGGEVTNYRLYGSSLGRYELVVGVSYEDTDRLRQIAVISFGWATAVILAAGLGAGALLAFRTRRRIAELSETMRSVGGGQLGVRLPVSSRLDDVDTLASEVNVALEQLEASVIALKQVTTDIAHDLKTPIGRLVLTLESALDQSGGGMLEREPVEAALAEVLQISGTFDALLRISQIEAGARRDRFEPFELRLVIEEAVEVHGPVAEEAGKQLRRLPDTDQAAFRITGDIDLLRQLCANLIANAIRHTPTGTEILISSGMDNGRPYLLVADNGPGIPEAERKKVFERFYRLEKSRTTDGSGLGLSMVKAVADLHGARVVLADRSPGLSIVVFFPQA
jgi:signal transduction histidine kinase